MRFCKAFFPTTSLLSLVFIGVSVKVNGDMSMRLVFGEFCIGMCFCKVNLLYLLGCYKCIVVTIALFFGYVCLCGRVVKKIVPLVMRKRERDVK